MRILVAIDGSVAAERAVDLAATLARDTDGHLTIVNVIAPKDFPLVQLDDYARWEHITPLAAMVAFSEERLRVARQRAEALGARDVESKSLQEIEPDDVAGSIVEAAQIAAADIVVIGKRGLGRLAGLILGSTSQRIVARATLPVVVVS